MYALPDALPLLVLRRVSRVPAAARNGWLANATLAASALLFLVLAIQQVATLVWRV